jgi:hypothetical protein
MTPSQITTLRAAVFADAPAAALLAAGNLPGLLSWCNGASSFVVWRSTTPAADIMDAITWASMTPTDTPDGGPAALQREYRCQGKQLNLQIMLQGRELVPTGRANVRAGLSDALLNVPAGAGGAMLDAGWLGAGKVKAAISRSASNAEKVFASGTGTASAPGLLGELDGDVSEYEAKVLIWKDNGDIWTQG